MAQMTIKSLGQYSQSALDMQYRRFRSQQAPATRSWTRAGTRIRRPAAPRFPTPEAAPALITPEERARREAMTRTTSRRLSTMMSPVHRRGSSRAAQARSRTRRRTERRERDMALKILAREAREAGLTFTEAARRVFSSDPAKMQYEALIQARLRPTIQQPPAHSQAVITPILLPPQAHAAGAELPIMPPGMAPELTERLVEARERLGIRT